MRVGWCRTAQESSAILPDPTPVQLEQDASPSRRNFQSCPAVKSTLRGFHSINSPFALRLRAELRGRAIRFIPVYPFTSLSEATLREIFRLEPRDSWRRDDAPIIQIPSPYMFIADEPAELEQSSPILAKTSSLNWRLIPGKFDIYSWQRPLNWAFEWDISCGDLIVRMGEPLYYLRFWNAQGAVAKDLELFEIPYSDELQKMVRAIAGVTAFRRGTADLIKRTGERRSKKLLPDPGG